MIILSVNVVYLKQNICNHNLPNTRFIQISNEHSCYKILYSEQYYDLSQLRALYFRTYHLRHQSNETNTYLSSCYYHSQISVLYYHLLIFQCYKIIVGYYSLAWYVHKSLNKVSFDSFSCYTSLTNNHLTDALLISYYRFYR